MASGLKRRTDALVLRWQARLDSEWSDRTLPWLLAGVLFVWLLLVTLAQIRSLDTGIDFGVATQATWLLRNREPPVVTAVDPHNVFAEQAAFVFWPISLLSYLLPIPATLAVVQAGALSLTVVPIWRVARRLANLRVGAAAALVVGYGLYPTMHNLNVDGFYPESIALPLLVWAFLFGRLGHWRRFAACCLAIVLCRADLGVVIAAMGGLLWWMGRPDRRTVLVRSGQVALAGGLAYTLLAVFVVQPALGEGVNPHIDAFLAYGDTPWQALVGMATSPGQVVGDLFRESNFTLLVTLFAPVLFLPFLAPRYLIPALPLQFFFLVGDVPPSLVYGRQTVPITAFVFVSAAFALAKLGKLGVERITVDRRILTLVVSAALVFFVSDAATSPYRQPWDWGGRDAADAARLSAAEIVGPDRSVSASASLLGTLAQRPLVRVIEQPDRPDPAVAGGGVDAVILDAAEVTGWTEADHRVFRRALEAMGFDLVGEEEGIETYLRRTT